MNQIHNSLQDFSLNMPILQSFSFRCKDVPAARKIVPLPQKPTQKDILKWKYKVSVIISPVTATMANNAGYIYLICYYQVMWLSIFTSRNFVLITNLIVSLTLPTFQLILLLVTHMVVSYVYLFDANSRQVHCQDTTVHDTNNTGQYWLGLQIDNLVRNRLCTTEETRHQNRELSTE